MAIVFISPKKKQRALFWSIFAFVILILTTVFLTAFPPEFGKQPKVALEDVFVPDIKVNFDILNSVQVKDLDPFSQTKLETENFGRSEPFLPY